MKAILVMDMPENCMVCPLCNGNDECIIQDEDANFAADTISELMHGCPLVQIDENKTLKRREHGMTEQKAIKVIQKLNICCICTTGPCGNCERRQAKEASLAALEEIQQYRKIGTIEEIKRAQRHSVIGTVEECREARARQTAQPPTITAHRYICPRCRASRNISQKYTFCPSCGQRLAWEQLEQKA